MLWGDFYATKLSPARSIAFTLDGVKVRTITDAPGRMQNYTAVCTELNILRKPTNSSLPPLEGSGTKLKTVLSPWPVLWLMGKELKFLSPDGRGMTNISTTAFLARYVFAMG